MPGRHDNQAEDAPAGQPRAGFAARASWAFYDWASSSFAAIIATFIFPAYFARQVAVDENVGTALWGYAVGGAGFLVAVLAPVLGAIADRSGRRKPWIAGFTLLCAAATAGLWWVKPGTEAIVPVLLTVGTAILAAEFAGVFYNAMLPSLAAPRRIGRWSGWAWGLGYFGGIVALGLAWLGWVGEDPWWNLPREEYAHVRATFVLVACWYLGFALPLLVVTPDEARERQPVGKAMREGLAQLRAFLGRLGHHRDVVRFLIARMVFIDGLATIFAFGGIYAAGTFDMPEDQVLLFGIALNVSAGVGAAAFAWVDDWLGSRRTMLTSLAGLIVTGGALLLVQSTLWFWLFGTALGVFIGPVQAAGRSYLAKAAPEALRNQLFGLFAFSGKATAFVGPLLVGWVTGLFDSQRAGMSVIVVLLALGFVLLLRVPEAEAADPQVPR